MAWDEALYANNALEMISRGEYIVKYYDNAVDMWNTKPPLLLWIQVFMINIFGFSEWIFRLPSAIFTLFWIIYITVFLKNITGSVLPGIFAALILVTSHGFVHFHISRTGDTDALLAIVSSIHVLHFFRWIFDGKRSGKKDIMLSALFLALAYMTKSVQALLFLPALVGIAIFYRKPFRKIIISGGIHFLFLLLLPGFYYISREMMNPGYLYAVYMNEWGGRYLQSLEGNAHPWYYYIRNLCWWHYEYGRRQPPHFLPWIFLLVPGMAILFFKKDRFLRWINALFLVSMSYLLIISVSRTKLEWYDAPVIPLLSILMGMIFYRTGIMLYARKTVMISYISLSGVIFSIAYCCMIQKISHVDQFNPGYYFRNYMLNSPLPAAIKIQYPWVHGDYWPDIIFYERYYETEYTVEILRYHNLEEAKTGDTVLTIKSDNMEEASGNFREIDCLEKLCRVKKE